MTDAIRTPSTARPFPGAHSDLVAPHASSRARRPVAGALFGVALGDALAAPTEFLSVPEIVDRFGPAGPLQPSSNVTDDTQMTIAVAEALLEAPRPLAPASLEAALRRRFVAWNESPENNRAPGTTCVAACNLLADGRDWIDATVLNSKGCGANMRAAPVGFLSFDRDGITPRTRSAVAQFQAALTHGHPTALASADLMATAVADLIAGGTLSDLLDRLLEHAASQRQTYHAQWLGRLWDRPGESSPQAFIARGWDECLTALRRVEAALARDERIGDVCDFVGEGWVAEEALAAGLLCVLLHPENPVGAIRRAAVTSGDSDSIAAIAGALAGAVAGLSGWPGAWVQSVEYAGTLRRLAESWEPGCNRGGEPDIQAGSTCPR